MHEEVSRFFGGRVIASHYIHSWVFSSTRAAHVTTLAFPDRAGYNPCASTVNVSPVFGIESPFVSCHENTYQLSGYIALFGRSTFA